MAPWYVVWLPWIAGTVAVHWLVPARWRPTGLMAAGAVFLATVAWPSALALLALTLLVHAAGRHARTGHRALWVACAIALAFVAGRMGQAGALMPLTELALLGVAYYVLRALHYLVEAWRGTLPAHSLADVLGYMFFPPTLPLGPIHRFEDFTREIRRLHWDPRRFAEGLERMLHGFAKVVVLAGWGLDTCLREAAEGLAASDPRAFAYVECVRAALGLYLRFAGYSDIAVGFALALGVRVPENFNAPFLATDLAELWRRWHMSLARWFRDYLYLPLAAGLRSPALATFATMVAIGVWHGASERFLAWGAYHGVGLVVVQAFGRVRPRMSGRVDLAWRGVAWLLTMNFFVLGFVITEAPSLAEAWVRYRLIFGW